ncbi:hypothetical protein DFJ77DRAFT_69613 [Powellomyces hirtus]|nr:hypothetical protein DFJ77DRAFT_69613 [Powellomyces hirtus]
MPRSVFLHPNPNLKDELIFITGNIAGDAQCPSKDNNVAMVVPDANPSPASRFSTPQKLGTRPHNGSLPLGQLNFVGGTFAGGQFDLTFYLLLTQPDPMEPVGYSVRHSNFSQLGHILRRHHDECRLAGVLVMIKGDEVTVAQRSIWGFRNEDGLPASDIRAVGELLDLTDGNVKAQKPVGSLAGEGVGRWNSVLQRRPEAVCMGHECRLGETRLRTLSHSIDTWSFLLCLS